MRIIKTADPAAIAAEMLSIERGAVYADVNGAANLITVYSTCGTIYLPLHINLADFCDHLAAVPELQPHTHASHAHPHAHTHAYTHAHTRASTPFTAVFAAGAHIRQILPPGVDGCTNATFTWRLEHIDTSTDPVYTVDDNIRRNLAAIMCDPDDLCILSGPQITITTSNFRGYWNISATTLVFSAGGVSPVLLNTDRYWCTRERVRQNRPQAQNISADAVPSALPVVDFDGVKLSGDHYCACCTRALAGNIYYIPSSRFGCINLCELCYWYDSSIKFKTAYGYTRDYSFLLTSPVLAALSNVRVCAHVNARDGVLLIGDDYMNVQEGQLLFTPVAHEFPGRKNVTLIFWP